MSETSNTKEHLVTMLLDIEKNLVRELGDEIGFGQMMRLAQECWRDYLIEEGWPVGGEFQVGPCVGMTVPCGCKGGCDWCAGSGWLTDHVKTIKDSIEEKK